MIANISPSLSACENTLNTLRYADRVKELRRNSTSNQSPPSAAAATPPIQARNPSLFHPSNIQLSSTPKVKDSSQEAQVDLMEGLQDPAETPIRGHKLQKSTETQRSRDMIPHTKTHPTGSPSKVSPFEFNIEKTGGIISITTSGRGREPRPCRSRESSSERSRRRSSTGSKGSPQMEPVRLSQPGSATPRSANTTRTSKSYRSKKSSESSSNGVNENCPVRDCYNKSNNSSHKSEGDGSGGSHRSYQEGTTEMTGIQGGKVTQPVVIRGRLSAQELSHTVGSQKHMATSVHAARQALASSSKSQQPGVGKPTVVDEHRQILSHLDNIMDRAKAAINKSADGTDLSSPSPQHRLAYRQQSHDQIHDPSSNLYKPSSSREALERLRTASDRPGNGGGSRCVHAGQTEEEYDIAQRSLLYDLQREQEVLLTGASERFLPLQEDLESIEQMEEVKHDRSDNMPDGHHYSPQQEGEGEGDTENEDVSSGDELSSEETSGDSSPSTEQEDLCSCAVDEHGDQAQGKGPGQAAEVAGDFQLYSPLGREQLQAETLGYSVQPGVPGSADHRASDSLRASLNPKSKSMHDITPHVEKIRDLLTSDITANNHIKVGSQVYSSSSQNGNYQNVSGRDAERVPRLSLIQMETFQNSGVALNRDKNRALGSRAFGCEDGMGELQILPQAEGFLKSLAGMKVSKKMLEEKVGRPSPKAKSAFTVNPALARLAQTFCASDNDQRPELFTSGFVQGNRATSLDHINAETRLGYGSDPRSVSDSGFGTHQETTEHDSQPHKGRTLEESDSENEVFSEASTMDGVVSLSVHLDDLQSALKRKLSRMPQKDDQAIWGQMVQLEPVRGTVGMSDGTTVEVSNRPALVSQSGSSASAAESHPVFVPIHPYPVSDSNRVVAPTVIAVPKLQGLQSEDHAEPVGTKPEESASDSGNEGGTGTPRSVASVSSARSTASAIQRAQNDLQSKDAMLRCLLLEAHEDQLAEITTLCKHEMRLLMAVKLGEKTYSDYVQELEELLSSKAAAISTLRAQLAEFTVHSAANTPRN